jgi:hypothetical protein
MWSIDQIAMAAAVGLEGEIRQRELEQSPYGIDALAELQLHPFIAAGLAAVGWGVFQEWPYPGEKGRRSRRTERERCDLVLTPTPDCPPRDPMMQLKELDAAAGTLFGAHVEQSQQRDIGTAPEEAFWLEIKLVGQFCFSAGLPGPNRAYASELLTIAPADIPKLARDPRIVHAGLLLVLLTADRDVADHDLAALMHRCLDRGLPVSSPALVRLPLVDRIGNGLCTVAVVPVRGAALQDQT